ncbi:MAG: fatty acid--CoA ligase [Pseudomonadota bacterium]
MIAEQDREEAVDFDAMPTLGDVARYHAHHRPEATALVFEGRETSYSAFNAHVNQVAQALLAAGLNRGDRIAYLGKNSDHYFELLFGALKVGVVMAPIGWRLAAPEIAYVLEDAGARMLFFGPEVAELARKATADLADLTLVPMEPGFEAWRDAQPPTDPEMPIDETEVAVQLYTSGTTGRPKGAMLSHRNILGGRRKAAEAQLAWNRWSASDISLVAMPVGHIGGTGWGIVGLVNGAKGVVAREFDPFKVLDYIENDHISKMFMVPAALQIVVRQPRARKVDYSRLKYILYGASPIPLDLLRECMEVFGCGFVQQYGMTETCGTIVYLPPEDHDPAGTPRMRAAGLPMPGVELKIVDEAGASLPVHTVGEVAVRSISNMAGYWGLPEATASTVGADGWLRTGDAGYLDEDGYLFIHDRVKDMIISGAENIYPAEVESAVYGHPDVLEVAVIGVPDDQWGEAVKAIVVPKPGTAPTPDDIIAFARGRIAGFKAPKSVDFIAALPRNASGKILRRELREPYWAGRSRRVN